MNRIYRIFSISRRSCLCIRSHWSLNFPKLNPLIVNSFKSEESHGLYRTVGVNNFCLDQGSPPEAQVLTNGPPVKPYSFEVGEGLSSTRSLIVNKIFNDLNGLNFRKGQTSEEPTHWEVESSASTERKYVFIEGAAPSLRHPADRATIRYIYITLNNCIIGIMC